VTLARALSLSLSLSRARVLSLSLSLCPSLVRLVVADPSSPAQTLLTNRILSAPVYNEDEKKYVGFLDMRDFVSFVVFFYHGEAEGGCSFVNIMREGLKSFNTPVDGITVSCTWRPLRCCCPRTLSY